MTGTPNTSVVWKASGGTISSGGLYTAGQTTGSYSVTATLSGGTMAGSAAVSISSTSGSYVEISPGESIQARIDANPTGTAFSCGPACTD